jgi:hypothetical protein
LKFHVSVVAAHPHGQDGTPHEQAQKTFAAFAVKVVKKSLDEWSVSVATALQS